MKTTRLQFVQGTIGVCVTGLLTAACGGDSPEKPDGAGGTGGGGACSSTIQSNHGHRLTVTKADAEAGVAKTYDIQGSSTHTHSVSISADEFAELLAGTGIIVTSTNNAGHAHEVMIECA